MIAFIDTSVILRLLFGEPKPLKDWSKLGACYASRMLRVELGRVIERSRLAGKICDADVAQLREQAERAMASIAFVSLNESILDVASGSLPTALGTLDAIHLATAVQLRQEIERELIFATHDAQLAIGARAMAFRVIGA
jgi:uncharacterized protein